ncbi:hypothetical protein Dimus_025849 [Dionaea muscipula]
MSIVAAGRSAMAMEVDQKPSNPHPHYLKDEDDDNGDPLKFVPSRGTAKRVAINLDSERDLNLAIQYFERENPPVGGYQFMGSSTCDDDDVIRSLSLWRPASGPSITEKGESSSWQREREREMLLLGCEVCGGAKFEFEFVKVAGCAHLVCFGCGRDHIVSKLDEGVSGIITCPVVSNCAGSMVPEHCHHILSLEICTRWGSMLWDSLILESQKSLCCPAPVKDIGFAMLIDDDGGEAATKKKKKKMKKKKEGDCPMMSCHHEGVVCVCHEHWTQSGGEEMMMMIEEDEGGRRETKLFPNVPKKRKWEWYISL